MCESELYTSSSETLVKYDFIAKLLKLEKKDKDINMRLLNDAFKDIECYLNLDLENMYNPMSFPEELKEAVVAQFIKKHSMYKRAADYATGDDIDDVLERKFDSGEIDFDEFFAEFSDISADILKLLSPYMNKTECSGDCENCTSCSSDKKTA
ncbi:MAG: hypothetical protein K6F69_09855 [Treponema sp.]|nr:hypothetical protein [Treponema sp.]